MINDKIKLIDELLKDDMKLEEYISEVNSKNIRTPADLNGKIYNSIKDNGNNIKKKDGKIFNLIKIAACAIFAITVWKIALDNPKSYNSYRDSQKLYNTKENIQGMMNNFSDMLMKPSDIKGGEK